MAPWIPVPTVGSACESLPLLCNPRMCVCFQYKQPWGLMVPHSLVPPGFSGVPSWIPWAPGGISQPASD